MKKSHILGVIVALALTWHMSGQTQVSAATTTTTQTAAEVLANIMANQASTPLYMYPQDFLTNLAAMGNCPYPPVPATITKSVRLFNRFSGGGFSPNDDQSTPPTYLVIDLGTLGANFTTSGASGINAYSQICGSSYNPYTVHTHAFIYSNSVMYDLGTLSGGLDSASYGINNKGQIAGEATISGGADVPFLYTTGPIQNVNTLSGSSFGRIGTGINDKEQISGYEILANNAGQAFLYSSGELKDIDTDLTGYSVAHGVNKSSQVVGTAIFAGGDSGQHAFLFTGNGPMQNIAPSGDTFSEALGINDTSQVVGDMQTATPAIHAFMYSGPGTWQDIHPSGLAGASIANAINNKGQVVGVGYHPDGSNWAFLYQGSMMYDLNTLLFNASSGWTLQFANAINDLGQIVGSGLNPAGQTHAFLLTPAPNITPFYQADGEVTGSGVPQFFGNPGAMKTGEDPKNFNSVDKRGRTLVYGCLLCSMASMLTSIPGFESTTPTSLDAMLILPANGYSGGDGLLCPSLPKILGNKITFTGEQISNDTTKLYKYLTNYFLDQGQRVILQLSSTPVLDTSSDVHYVLVTGQAGNDWKVFDPGWRNAYPTAQSINPDPNLVTSFAAHTNGFYVHPASAGSSPVFRKFYIAGVRTFGPNVTGTVGGNFSGTVHSPVELLVTDPYGNRVGYDTATGTDVFEIPGSSYIRDYPIDDADLNVDPSGDQYGIKTFYIPSPVGGNYQVKLTGTASGSYTFDMGTYWPSGGSQAQTITGTTSAGVTSTNQLFVKLPAVMSESSVNAGVFSFSFTSQSNVTYNVQGNSSLNETNWTTLQTLSATSATTAVNQMVTNDVMFYRVIAQ